MEILIKKQLIEAVNNGIDALESLVIANQTTGDTLPQLTFNQAA
jgi:hypothetical protein